MRRFLILFTIVSFLLAGNILNGKAAEKSTLNLKQPPSAYSVSGLSGRNPLQQNRSCQKADKFLQKKQINEALEALNKCISKDQKNVTLYMKRGNIWAMKGDWAAAIRDFSKAIQLRPGLFRAYELRGLSKVKSGKVEKGLKDIDKAIALNPKSSQLLSRKGSVLVYMGKLREAVKVFTKVIKLSPGFFGGYVNRANVYERLGKWILALKDYNKAIELEPAFPPLHFTRGLVLFYKGEFKKAAYDFKIAYEGNKKNEQVGLMMALALLRMGNKKEARKILMYLDRIATMSNKSIAELFLGKIYPKVFIKSVKGNVLMKSTFMGFLGEYHLVHHDKKKARKAFEVCVALDALCKNIPCRFSKAELERLNNTRKIGRK